MKKISLSLVLLLAAVVALSACGPKKKPADTTASTTKESTVASTEAKENTTNVVLTAVLLEDASVDGDTIRLSLGEVTAVEDPEKIAAGFGEGVVLNAGKSQLPADFKAEDYPKGTKLKVTLVPMPVTTRSLPPQIPGNSIVSIEKN